MNIGDKLVFGDYEWLILDIKDDKALIITTTRIEQRAYHNKYEDITWAKCSLRKYLNTEFYDKFKDCDKIKIIPVINENPDNPWFNTKGGEDTEDKIFILNLVEVACKYFGDSSDKLYNKGKNQNYWFQRKDVNNNNKRILMVDGHTAWWWVRTPGRVSLKAIYIHGDGNIGIQGNNILKGNIADGYNKGGVRPALWLKIDQKGE